MSGGGFEIERKYLLAGAPAASVLASLGARPVRIEQVYLRAEDDWVRRVRRSDAQGAVRYVLTRKRELSGIVREEIEADLTAEDYGRLLADADPARRVIRKTRHVISHGSWTLELDVFSEPPGLVLLEVELGEATEVPDLPPEIAALVVREVSTETAYTNHHLALRPAAPAAATATLARPAAATAGLAGPAAGTARTATTPGRPGDPSDELPPAEAARARRRDRDAAAAERSGMRTGLAKQFKQVLDAQVKRAREARDHGAPRETRDAPDEDGRPGRHAPRKHRHRRGEP